MKLIANPHDPYRLGNFLLEGLESDALSFSGASAFARRSGIGYLAPAIRTYSADRLFQLVVGIDLNGTSVEALELLLDSAGTHAHLFVFHNPAASFHPKTFRFEYSDRCEIYAGSGNLTRGGLFGNYETGFAAALFKGAAEDEALNVRLDAEFERWSNVGEGSAIILTATLIKDLRDRKLILPEARIRAVRAAAKVAAGAPKKKTPLFPTRAVPGAPIFPAPLSPAQPQSVTSAGPAEAATPADSAAPAGSAPQAAATSTTNFVITAQQTDVGHGQTTPGTQERAAEYFIPLATVRHEPGFWGWPSLFVDDPTWTKGLDKDGRGRMHRRGMPFYVDGEFEWVTMTYNPDKHDFRLGNQRLRNSGSVGDVLKISIEGATNPVYVAAYVSPGSLSYATELARCTIPIKAPSKKRFGYY